MHTAIGGLFVGALALSACKPTHKQASPPTMPAAAPARPGLAADASERDWDEVWPVQSTAFADLVPANSPFVLVNMGPLPDGALDFFEPFVAPFLEAVYEGIHRQESEEAQRVLDFMGPSLDADDLRRAGFDPNPRVLFYAFGPAPVIRISLSDPAMVEASLERARKPDARASNFHGQRFWELALEGEESALFGALAVNGEDLVVSVFPEGYEDELLPMVFGQKLPAERLWDTGFLEGAQREFGLLPHYLLRVNLYEFLAMATGRSDARSQALMAAMGVNATDNACVDDILRLAESVPLLYAGVREFGAHGIEASFVLDLDAETARALANLTGPIPGLSEQRSTPEALAGGFGFDFAGVAPLFQRWGEAVERRPFVCDELAPLNLLEQPDLFLQMLPPDLRMFTGASAFVQDLGKFEEGNSPAVLVLGLEDPVEAMAGPFARDLGVVPQHIERRRTGKLADAVPGTATDDALAHNKITRGRHAIAIGTQATSNATLYQAADRERPNDGTIALMRWNAVAFYSDLWRASKFEQKDPRVEAIGHALLSLLTKGSVTLRARDSGLTLDVSLTRPESLRKASPTPAPAARRAATH